MGPSLFRVLTKVFFRMGSTVECLQSWGTVLGFIGYVGVHMSWTTLDTYLLFQTSSYNTTVFMFILHFFWMYRGTMQLWPFLQFFINYIRVNIASVVLLLGREPYCCTWMFTSALSLAFTTLCYNFTVWLNFIPMKLLHLFGSLQCVIPTCLRLPFGCTYPVIWKLLLTTQSLS